jgi:hypothetical protein
MHQANDRLTLRYDLPRLRQGLDNGAIGIGNQQRIIACIAGDLRHGFRGGKLRIGSIERSLYLLVFLLS